MLHQYEGWSMCLRHTIMVNRVITLGSGQAGFVTEFSRKHSLASSGLGSVHMEWAPCCNL